MTKAVKLMLVLLTAIGGMAAAQEAKLPVRVTHLKNPLAIDLGNYGRYQDAAWTHLPSLAMHDLLMKAPLPGQVAAIRKRLAEHHLFVPVLRSNTDLGRTSSVDELAGQLAVCRTMGVRYLDPIP